MLQISSGKLREANDPDQIHIPENRGVLYVNYHFISDRITTLVSNLLSSVRWAALTNNRVRGHSFLENCKPYLGSPSMLNEALRLIRAYHDISQTQLCNELGRLATHLRVPIQQLVQLSKSLDNYKEFLLPEEVCPFTGKVKKERWVQEPKAELRTIHERLQKLLRFVSPPGYAHASIKERSYRSNALAHN